MSVQRLLTGQEFTLEVHLPHHAINGWKDFFVHIGTITVGLLIAIGLEQSVEAIHRHHELVQLREDLHSECERNKERLDILVRIAGDNLQT